MKKSPQTTNKVPAWQTERAKRLHRICCSIAARAARGEKKRRLIRWFVWYWKGRCYECDSSRPLGFSKSTIERAFYLWKRGGQVAAALVPQYKPRQTTITAPALVRFAEFCASQPLPSMRAAWEKFRARRGSFGRGKHASKPLKISYGQLRYHFLAADFYMMQAEIQAGEMAKTKLAQLRLKVVADIRRRLPDRPPRRRVKREIDFEI